VDTGLADRTHVPNWLPSLLDNYTGGADGPDTDQDGFLDPVAGHGTFIAGIIAQIAPECSVQVIKVLKNLGDTNEYEIGQALDTLPGQVDFVNLSFSGYVAAEARLLATVVRKIQRLPAPASRTATQVNAEDRGGVVVASAGNDATWRAPFPAALLDVVSVAALGPDGPAPFTNYGPWVRACAPGVDVVSTFFENFDGGEPAAAGPGDTDKFTGWARWSGTSFAAPAVVARLAREVHNTGCSPKQAVARLIDAPGLAALPWHGTIVTP
jgi:hypothetical protein